MFAQGLASEAAPLSDYFTWLSIVETACLKYAPHPRLEPSRFSRISALPLLYFLYYHSRHPKMFWNELRLKHFFYLLSQAVLRVCSIGPFELSWATQIYWTAEPKGASAMKIAHALRVSWKSFQYSSEVLFRALGLNLILVGLRSLRRLAVGRGFDEPTKIAIRKSRKTALLRALIHIVPLGVALWEISFNWNTYYVGSNVQSQALYQFGAKLHEMTAQASIAAVMFSYVRYELSLGQGLPFGALFSGLQVSQASYLWSTEFWGSIYSTSISFKRKMGMAVIIIIAIFLAATVGPSSAILLIPRLEYWPAGSTDIWINATAAELWPDV